MQKLTMLVAFPLVFEFIFVGSLAALLVTAQADTRRIEAAKETQSVSNEIVQSMYKLVSTAFLSSIKRDENIELAYTMSKEHLVRQLEKLRVVCASDPAAKRSSEIVTVLSNRLVDDLDVLTNTPLSGLAGFLATAEKVGNNTKLIMAECSRIAAIQGRIHSHPTSNTDWQTIIYSVLAAGMLLSLAVSGGALRYVHLDLLQRISQMMENIGAIARRAPLSESVSGTDELAQLDKFIHTTDDTLRQLERSRQEFMSMLTHDMRAPLTQIQFSVSLLADGTYEDAPAKRREMLRTLVPEISRLNRLVEDLLTANKLDAEPMKLSTEKLSSAALLDGVRQAMATEAESRGRKIDVVGTDVDVLADEFQISRVLINLCANALKYTPSGSTVKLMCTPADERVIFSVEDHGPGIPEKLQPHLFERYQQGQDEITKLGFGLGLYICKSIVEAHGEKIWFENKHGDDTGCRFLFTLKRAV